MSDSVDDKRANGRMDAIWSGCVPSILPCEMTSLSHDFVRHDPANEIGAGMSDNQTVL